MKYWEDIFYLIVLAVVLRIAGYVIERFANMYSVKNILNRISYGLVSRKDLKYLSNSEFIRWCTGILENMGFSNIGILNTGLKSDYQILARINSRNACIKCIKLEHMDAEGGGEDDYETVELSEIQSFVGTMEHDGISIGYVFTNGCFSSEALEYSSTLPDNLFLKTVDGCELTRLHRRRMKQYLTPNL
ncbi:MAG: restriction endonuclease [Bacillota bacterium]|nr:restriction endonuclease [Bacillota bacterium]